MSETADAIMDAAERRIRKAGYSGFSFREIAADVGVKSASVHYHFPTKERLAASVARRYTERFLSALDQEAVPGRTEIEAWITAFRRALHGDGKMCLCGVLGATSHDLPEEVMIEARRFFQLCLEKLEKRGLSHAKAVQTLAALEGAMLLANVLGDPSTFDEATASLAA
ncbi:TetR/AcrR family transcriptional regulator [Novosphingobium panipatense]|uniref:TetR/AcrR family transcriptional regulator n=1 Tax=Novosphingobium panipatense TaxID=428991 RepID=UPI0024B7ECC1|nr:TetR/AcrR family transcriptional regulator [Novosphingobium panipatense]